MTGQVQPIQVSPPQFALSELAPEALIGADVIALPVLPADEVALDPAASAASAGSAAPASDPGALILGPGAEEISEALSLDLLGALDACRATGKAGEVITVPVPAGSVDRAQPVDTGVRPRLVMLVGVGDLSPHDLRRAGAALARATKDRDALVTSVAAVGDEACLEAFVVGMMLASFDFGWRSAPPETSPVSRVVLAGISDSLRGALSRSIAIGGAAWRARMLATVPSNLKNPQWLAEQAEEIAEDAGLTCRVWDEKSLADQGFGGLVCVGQGSATPPRLIRLDYAPARGKRKTPTVVLVGKGITFDSGGLSIKPAEAMATMKRDMTGGAVVMSTMAALAAVECPVRVIGLIPAAENAISGSSIRPGDVIRHYGGRTSEITNTDAEGRLVLADAMAYAVDKLDPAALVDVATLTGGIKVALGQQVGGLFADNEALAASLLEAGSSAGEPLWRFPLHAGYEGNLASKVADADNGPSGPGAIMAALFLQHFTDEVPWAHLDIASVGDAPADHDEYTAGPTGFGTRLLLHWLGSADPLAGVSA